MLRVPYTGYNGDYQAIVALTPTPAGFPWLAKIVGPNLVNQPGGASSRWSATMCRSSCSTSITRSGP